MPFGIICEYNPFHNGHLHQIKKIREISDEPIICVMSGNFTQRGELSVADKYVRARTAIDSGADMVLELPFPYCVSSAEFFATAGVRILTSVGVDKLSCGCETLDAEKAFYYAEILRSEKFKYIYSERSKKEGNVASYFSVLKELSGETVELFSNDILAVEYAKAILEEGAEMSLHPIKREGTPYLDRELCVGELPSAAAIREKLYMGDIDGISALVPKATIDMLKSEDRADIKNIGDGILLFIRLLSDKKIANVAINDKGLVSRIIQGAKEAKSFSDFEAQIQTKKYTKASIRRAMWYLVSGVTFSDLRSSPAYTILLGADSKGRKLLSQLRNGEGSIPIITKPADSKMLKGDRASRQLELSEIADSIYTLSLKNKKTSSEYMKRSPYLI